jgi:phosphonate transport system permease protein
MGPGLDLDYFGPTLDALIETFHIATLGTILALVMALPVGFLAARNVTPNAALNLFAKFIFVTSRSVNSLIWALLFVAMFGPGPLAGTLAIAFRSIGFTGKLFAEALEEANRGSIEALTAAGASRLSTILLGYWPQVRPSFWSITLFRWDINIRESARLAREIPMNVVGFAFSCGPTIAPDRETVRSGQAPRRSTRTDRQR